LIWVVVNDLYIYLVARDIVRDLNPWE